MDTLSLEIFMPVDSVNDIPQIIDSYRNIPALRHLWLWCASPMEVELPANVTLSVASSLTATAVFKDMAERASAEFVLYVSKPCVEVCVETLVALCRAMPADASMAYAHYRKVVCGNIVDAPTIECFDGSLRNDFDFGPVRLFRTSALKQYLASEPDDYEFAALYQLRLELSRLGKIFHFTDYLSLEHESDNRKSGEKQFDYVNPAQRAVQVEMELACTAHLKAVGAWLPPCRYKGVDLHTGEFPVEASVVIPVLNRESTIADAIASVLQQTAQFKFNILVVDNHSTDGTGRIIDSFNDERVVHIVPERTDLGIGGCWNLAVNDSRCGRFAVQLDSDDIYSDSNTLQRIVDEFYRQQCAMLVGTYRICDFELNTLPPGVIDHREWTEDNGRNNALRINGLGAPRAFFTPVIREVGFPNVSYGEDYAVGLQISRNYRIGRIYDVLYLCRRWGGNSDAALSHEKVNAHNLYKDSLRTAEFNARKAMMQEAKIPSQKDLEAFFENQLAVWDDAAERYRNLEKVQLRALGNGLTLQYNPSRMISTSAKVDADAVKQRKCFLCSENRPECQSVVTALGVLDVLVNPYPILPFHFTLILKEHIPQLLSGMYGGMLLLAREWRDMAIFYNGAKCGASAPDHSHLQAVCKNDIPLLGVEWQERVETDMEPLLMNGGDGIYRTAGYAVPLFVIKSGSVSGSMQLIDRLLSSMPLVEDESEPRMNVICEYRAGEGFITYIFPRSKHRPQCYYAEGDTARMVSPGTLDMAGLIVTPRENDFLGITADEAMAILQEVAVDADAFDEIAENVVACYEKC